MSPRIIIIAGPNGAGKTTFAREFLPFEADCPIFVNADLIAAGIAPFQPETVVFRAGRLMLQELAHHSAEGCSFAFETTLSGRSYAPMIDTWRANGYTVKLIFLSLASADEAVARVANRVRQGGHNIPTETIRRRFESGLIHFRDTYRHRVDFWQLFDNSGDSPLLIEERANP
ncbi:conserved hypothetical protein [Candidatus Accumulibacter aalborgensis]|uniref:Zeta toxin domain-containing protein n=1 Tax=Candidatus Accumulibacter aalborgensis TaxID=1860102 RepID=A0A1A8XLK5_9PROT|nr:zeta toxin family protein [Candidatus Accumulibacter aalborgensis]SBT05292.1 conserved hypothetical protein [Candidatus Accumulibacter aalborgensis]